MTFLIFRSSSLSSRHYHHHVRIVSNTKEYINRSIHHCNLIPNLTKRSRRLQSSLTNENDNVVLLHSETVSPKQNDTSSSSSSSSIIVDDDDNDDSKKKNSILFLHGLLGNGKNLKTLASKVCTQFQQEGMLMDLRGHGKSYNLLQQQQQQSTTTTTTTSTTTDTMNHTFEACVNDITYTLNTLNVQRPTTLIGHSWGGRLALQYAASSSSSSNNNDLKRLWLLDTIPGQANESVERVIYAVTSLLEKIQQQQQQYEYENLDKKQIVTILTKEYNIDIPTAQWLALSYNKSKLTFGFNLNVIHELLPQFETQDFFHLLETSIKNNPNLRIDLVRGGKNNGWTIDILRQLQSLESSQFQIHVLPKAGHWVHVDDLSGLLQLMKE